MMLKLRVGVIGNGAWGKKVQETLTSKTEHCELANVFSRIHYSPARFENLSRFDFIVIATPFKTHAQYMRLCLEQNVPFVVEKPAASCIELEALRREFEKPNVTPRSPLILCNHTLLFNPAIEAMHAAMQNQVPMQLRGEHGGPGPIRDDCSALLDYGAHGIALAFWLSGASKAIWIRVDGTPLTPEGTQSFRLQMFAAHLNVLARLSNEYKFKRLKYTVSTDTGNTYRFDDRDEHKLYRYSGPRLEALEYAKTEPLTNALDTFAKAVKERALEHVTNDARFGWALPMAVMSTLEAAEELVRVSTVAE